MKKILFSIACFFVSTAGTAQNAYYDAIRLNDKLDSATDKFELTLEVGGVDSMALKFLYGVLRPYWTRTDLKDSANFLKAIKDPANSAYNPFIARFIDINAGDDASSPFTMRDFQHTSAFSGGSITSKAMNTDVTTLADGLAKFLIKRAKQELSITFFDRFKNQFLPEYPEFGALFPRTTSLLNSFAAWEYSNIIITLREAFDKDLQTILLNIPSIAAINDPSDHGSDLYKRLAKEKAFLAGPSGLVLLVGGDLLTGKKLPVILDELSGAVSKRTSPREADVRNIMALTALISDAFTSVDYSRDYITSADFDQLIASHNKLDLFGGLLYQRIKNAGIIIGGVSVAEKMKGDRDMVTHIHQYMRGITTKTAAFNAAVDALKDAKRKGETTLDPYWAAIIQSGRNMFPAIANVEIIYPSWHLPPDFANVFSKAEDLIDISHDLVIRNYNAGLVGILNLIPDTPDNAELKAFLVKYGSFAANMAAAQNSDDVEAAIEAVALPVGSASIKKNSNWNVSLNAYIGGFYGREYLASKTDNKWSGTSGLSAPIGIAVSHGLPWGFSISAFVSIIDIGAIASYRLHDSTTAKLPKVTLQNIFAPGGGLVLGIPKFPVSIGYLSQAGPALRNVNVASNSQPTSQLNVRHFVFLAVDIPLVNLYTRQRKKPN